LKLERAADRVGADHKGGLLVGGRRATATSASTHSQAQWRGHDDKDLDLDLGLALDT
jgi:hypothetical protein